MPYFAPNEDELLFRCTNELGDDSPGPRWRIAFRDVAADISDHVTDNEADYLDKLGVAPPISPHTRRVWLDGLLVGRLLRAAPLSAPATLMWEPFITDVEAALDHFIREHLRAKGYTETGEAVLACVAAVPRMQLRLRDYDLVAAKPAAEAARKIIFDAYVQHLNTFALTSPLRTASITSARREGALDGGQDEDAGTATGSDMAQGAAREA